MDRGERASRRTSSKGTLACATYRGERKGPQTNVPVLLRGVAPIGYRLMLTIAASGSYPSSLTVSSAFARRVFSSASLGALQWRRITSSPLAMRMTQSDFPVSQETSTLFARISPPAEFVGHCSPNRPPERIPAFRYSGTEQYRSPRSILFRGSWFWRDPRRSERQTPCRAGLRSTASSRLSCFRQSHPRD